MNNSQEPNQEAISLNEGDDEIAQMRDRIQALEHYAESNRRRIRNGKALNALLAVITPFFLFSGEFHFGEKWGGNLRSRDFNTGDAISLLGVGLTALGVISSDELGKIFMKK